MPTGMGTWPAWWSYGPDWPENGEIDTIETVNMEDVVQQTLHTSDPTQQWPLLCASTGGSWPGILQLT